MHPRIVRLIQAGARNLLPTGFSVVVGSTNGDREYLLSCGHLYEKESIVRYRQLKIPILPCNVCRRLVLGMPEIRPEFFLHWV